MPTEAELSHQRFLEYQNSEAQRSFDNFRLYREKPSIEQEEKRRLSFQTTPGSALKSFFLTPETPQPKYKLQLGEVPKLTGEALMGMGIRTGMGAISGLKGYVKETMPTGAYKRIIEEEHPGVAFGEEMAGKLGIYSIVGKAFAPLMPFISKSAALSTLKPGVQTGIGAAASRAATWGTVKFADNLSKVLMDMEDATIQNMLLQPLEASGWGAVLGASHMAGWPTLEQLADPSKYIPGHIKNTFAHFLLTGIIGGAREGLDKFTSLLANEKITMDDVQDIGTAALFTAIVESIGHHQLVRAWEKANIERHYFLRNSQKLEHQGMSKAKAEETSDWLNAYISNIQTKPEYIDIALQKMPNQFYSLQPQQQADMITRMADLIKYRGMSFANAFNTSLVDITATEKPKLLPFKGKPEAVIPKTYEQVKYGHVLMDELKQKGWEEEDIAFFKMDKSFADMTSQEATRAIDRMKKIIDITEQLEKVSEDPPEKIRKQVLNKFKQLEKKEEDKAKYMKMIKETIPVNLQNDVGRDVPLIGFIRPSEKVFRRDPFVWERYQDIKNGYADFKIDYEARASEAEQLARKLKLTVDDLKLIDERRQLLYFKELLKEPKFQNTSIPELTTQQLRFDNYLTKNYRFLHEYLGIKRKIPYHMYSPLLRETHDAELAVARAFFPEEIPEDINAFMHHERTARDKEGFRTNALENYKKYLKSGLKKKHMEESMRKTRNEVMSNPYISGTMKKFLKHEASWLMGWPSALDASYTAMFKDLGMKPDDAALITRILMNNVYSSVISPRPQLLLKQLLQNTNIANELGYIWTMKGLSSFLQEGFDEPQSKGMILEFMPEAYREYGEKYPLDRTREAMAFPFHKLDQFGRALAYYTARDKFNKYYNPKLSKNISEFMSRVGINHLDKPVRWKIHDALRKGEVEKARDIFAKDIVRKAHYLYGKQDAALIQKWWFGKQLMQLHTWPENYTELLVENTVNKHGMFFLRQLIAFLIISWLGHKTQQKWMVGYPVTSLPLNSYRFEKYFNLEPVSLLPLIDLLFVVLDPATRYLYTASPEKAKSKFKRKLKKFGRDIFLYIPGGLVLRDLFNVTEPFTKPQKQKKKQFGHFRIVR